MVTLYPLSHRGIVRLTGPDRRAFLQGLISNDVALCQPGHPIYAALLTPQGKFLHDLFVIEHNDSFLIDCERARADDLLQGLAKYKLRAKVGFENLTTQYEVWAALETLPEAAAELIAFVDPRLAGLGQRLVLRQGAKLTYTETSDAADYDSHRLRLGIPDGSRDMLIEKSTLIECNLDQLNAISLTKGCYIGQELTARMHYRGLAKKRLFPVTITGATPDRGTIISDGDSEVGEMRSVEGSHGFALLKIEQAQRVIGNRLSFKVGTTTIMPYQPEWLKL